MKDVLTRLAGVVVGVIDGVADLAGEVERAIQFEPGAGGNQVLERLALDVLHDDEEDVVLLFRRGDGDDIRMADAREQARLTQQLAEVEVLSMGDLDRDLLVDPGVLREVNGSESAAAKRRHDLVLSERLASEQQRSADCRLQVAD